MRGELFINGKDAYTTWGVSMGDNFLDTLEAPLSVKDYISNESRTEDGKRVITDKSMIKIAARDVTLQFHICGKSQSEYLQNKKAFQQELYSGVVDINIPARGSEVYHLLYLGKQVSYSQSFSEGKLSAKFEEPNPTNRE
jgi:hypothetical protein